MPETERHKSPPAPPSEPDYRQAPRSQSQPGQALDQPTPGDEPAPGEPTEGQIAESPAGQGETGQGETGTGEVDPKDGQGERGDPHVRTAGPKEMSMPPRRWTRTDEELDESFPASDPPGNY